VFPEWPGNDEANKKLEDQGVSKTYEGVETEDHIFKDNFEYFLPPSIKD